MSANFNFYLNRQGPKGRKGDQGEQGYSPSISVETETAAEYTLKIQNEGYSFTTPNLRGNAIENTGGTYVRYNPDTEQMYTGELDLATVQRAGGVLLTASGRLEQGGSSGDVPTSAEVYDYVESKISSIGEGYVREEDFDDAMEQIASELDGKISFDDLASSLVEGDNITLDVDSENGTITINAAGGDLSNYVTTNTNQTITGYKTFGNGLNSNSHVTINGSTYGLLLNAGALTGSIVRRTNALEVASNGKMNLITSSKTVDVDELLTTTDLNSCVKTTGDQAISGFKTFLNSPILKGTVNSTLEFDNGNNDTEVAMLQYTFNNNRFTISSEGSMYLQTATNSINVDDILTSSGLTNVVTTNTAQTISGAKTFTSAINLKATSPYIYFKSLSDATMGYIRFDSTGTTMRAHSNGAMYLETSQHSGSNAINVDNLVVQTDISTKENTSNKVTSISSSSTNTEYPSALAVYNAIQTELGNITTLLNNINSGSGS